MLIGLMGFKRSGKDTVADMLVDTFGFKKLAFADVIKERIADLFQCSVDSIHRLKTGSAAITMVDSNNKPTYSYFNGRRLIRELGMMLREANPNYMKDLVAAKMTDLTVVSDVRFVDEVDWIREHGGYLLFIDREQQSDGHVSESDLRIFADKIIDNTGLLQATRNQIQKFIETAGNKCSDTP